jgi:ligand-binding sensor domain-containing protein/signal transduction histidine kinase
MRMLTAVALLAAAWAMVPAAASTATVDSVRFRNFGLGSGLSQVTARAIVQDERGFVWIGTQDGLNRFDGHDFETWYRDRRSQNTLGDSHVTALARAEGGRLWVGTLAGGLSLLDPAAGTVRTFRHDPAQDQSLASDGVTALHTDRGGRLWVATANGGLQQLFVAEGRFVRTAPQDIGVVRSIAEVAGVLWFAGNRGLWQHRIDGGTWQRMAADIPGADDLQSVVPGAAGSLWVGTTGHGLLHLDSEGQVLAHHRAGLEPGRMQNDQVTALLLARDGDLWVGTMDGVSVLEPGSGRFRTWRHQDTDPGSPAGNRIASLYQDREGLLWIGTWTGGFSIHNPATQGVRLIRAHGRDASSLPANPVRALWRDADGSLWLGLLEGGGLVHYDLARGVLGRWTHDPLDPNSLGSNAVQAIARTPDGRLWVGTQGGGLSRMLVDGSGFESFRRNAEGDRKLPDDVVQMLHVDRSGTLWAGFETGGLARWEGEGAGFTVYRHDPADPGSLPVNRIYSMAETDRGELWIGTFGGGLVRMDREAGTFESYRELPGRLDTPSHNSITMILEARDGTLWFGTQGGGLNRMIREADGRLRFEAIDTSSGLGANAIGVLVEDRAGKLWIGTTVGVNAYNPATGEVESFSASDGMDRSGYFIGSAALGEDGEIYFGGLRGLLVFHPERLPRRELAPSVVLTSLQIDHRTVQPRGLDPSSPLPLAITDARELRLPKRIASIAIGFSALDYVNPDGIRYSFRLDGLDQDWIEAPEGRRVASYTNLAPGEYRFEVRARDGEGGQWGEARALAIVVPPPAWQRPEGVAGAAVLALLLAWLAWRRTRARWDREAAAQEAIRHSEERLKLALWASRDELWDLDITSKTLLRENMLPILGGRSRIVFADRNEWLAEVYEDDREAALAALERHIEGATEFYESTYRMHTLDGHRIWVLSRGMAVARDRAGRALRMVGTHRDISASAEAAESLRRLNDELEQRVDERTRALKQANHELEFMVQELKLAQRRLVESEKMAALGGLVAGIAHEINTPLGIGVTAASHLEDETRRLMREIEEGRVSRRALLDYQQDALDSTRLILANLRRAGQLIRSFKQVAVDQSSEQAREVHLKSYLDEVLVSLGPALKKTRHRISVKCPDELRLYTYPGAISQILVNLVMNSLIHGFEGIEQGHIDIQCEGYDEEWLLLYRDDGVGMSEEVRQRVFDPFFTTKRGQGGSGLGLHVVYNLVTQLLRGSLDCISAPGKGVEFQIQMPRRVVGAEGR